MSPPFRFSGLTTVPDAGPTGRRLTSVCCVRSLTPY